MESQIIDGKVYGLPKAVETQILYYNKDLIKDEELPQTTDEWLEYSKKVTKDGNLWTISIMGSNILRSRGYEWIWWIYIWKK